VWVVDATIGSDFGVVPNMTAIDNFVTHSILSTNLFAASVMLSRVDETFSTSFATALLFFISVVLTLRFDLRREKHVVKRADRIIAKEKGIEREEENFHVDDDCSDSVDTAKKLIHFTKVACGNKIRSDLRGHGLENSVNEIEGEDRPIIERGEDAGKDTRRVLGSEGEPRIRLGRHELFTSEIEVGNFMRSTKGVSELENIVWDIEFGHTMLGIIVKKQATEPVKGRLVRRTENFDWPSNVREFGVESIPNPNPIATLKPT